MTQRGFSLVELMITLVLGIVISGAIIQALVSSRVTNSLNDAIAQVQESGRFIMVRLNQEIIEAGRYDMVSARIDNSVDTMIEAAFIQNRPVAIPGDFSLSSTLGATQGASGNNDELVVNLLGSTDCTGSRHGYAAGDEFHVVNHYFVANEKLKCVGYDGRVLRGKKTATISTAAITLMDNVKSFQVQYGVSAPADTSRGQAVQYVTANELAALRNNNQQVVAIRLGLLLSSDSGQVRQTTAQRYAVLNEAAVTMDQGHYHQVFTQTLALRNIKNFLRSAQ